jgi:hypothetical protein
MPGDVSSSDNLGAVVTPSVVILHSRVKVISHRVNPLKSSEGFYLVGITHLDYLSPEL